MRILGECKCFPGYDDQNNCEKCADVSSTVDYHGNHGNTKLRDLCSLLKYYCSNSTVQDLCPNTCLVNNCYLPPALTPCEANSCNGHGMCTTQGTCIHCEAGYSGTYCQHYSGTVCDICF